MAFESQPVTFRSLEKTALQKDDPEPSPSQFHEYHLLQWYESVRDKPIGEFSVEDICKACRQRLFLGHVVPNALDILKRDYRAGEVYEGELLASLRSIPVEYWRGIEPIAHQAQVAIEQIQVADGMDPEIRQDWRNLIATLFRVTVQRWRGKPIAVPLSSNAELYEYLRRLSCDLRMRGDHELGEAVHRACAGTATEALGESRLVLRRLVNEGALTDQERNDTVTVLKQIDQALDG